MKKIKKSLLASLVSVFMLASVGGVVVGQQASAETQKSGFYVEDGAAVRLRAEHENFGIKFSAQVGEAVEGATYNILIAPIQLVDLYENDTNPAKGDIITYLTSYAESKGGKLSIVKDCEVKNGKIEGAIVNVLWQNITRKFVGVAYYEKDGVITVAQYADDKERSVVDVSVNALESGDYDANNSSLKLLLEKVRYGEMVENGASEDEKNSAGYQYERFYGASVNGSTVTTAAGTAITLSGLTGDVGDNVLSLSNTASGASATINFGKIPAGTYRVQLEHALVNGEFTSSITQNGNRSLATVWETKAVGDNVYEFYFTQETEGNASFTISTESAAGTVTLDNIVLEPVTVEELEYSRDKYMFGVGGLTAGVNASEGNWCDSKVTSEWMSLAVNQLGVESQRVWMSVPHIITRAEDSNELSIKQDVANTFHNHFLRLKAAGVKRIMVMLSRFVYPYDYEHCSANCAPDPNKEADVYKTWLEMQYNAFKLIAKEFPEITLWECGNEQDLDTFLYKNGLKDKDSWGLFERARDYTFTNEEKAYITADICYIASKAFKLYNPEAQIIMPGMSKYAARTDEHPYGTGAYYFEEFYKHIESGKLPTLETVKVTDPDQYFDIIAYHVYAKTTSDFETYNDTLLATAAEHGDGEKRVWITELGFTEEGFGGKGTAEAQDAIATLTGDLLDCLSKDKYVERIETVFFFRVSDTAGLTAENIAESCYGMYNSPNASLKANEAKPWAVVLHNYFNDAAATVDEITFWKGSETSEDFENVLFGENMLMNVGPNISLWNVKGELVDYDGGKALKVHYDEATNAYNSITINFGTLTAGNYKVSLTYKVLDGRYSGAIVASGEQSEFTYVSATTALGDDTYCFYFNQAEKGSKSFVLSAQQWGMSGTILIDNISIEEVVEIPVDNTMGAVSEENFDSVEFIHGQTSDIGGVYITPRKLNAEMVSDGNGGEALKVTKVEGGYAWAAISLGDLQKGMYTLTMDVDSDNYSAIIQMFTLSRVNGCVKHTTVLGDINNYSTLFKLASAKGNTYSFTFELREDYENLAVALVDSSSNVGVSITIDNVKLAKTLTVDFENNPKLLYGDKTYTFGSIELAPTATITNTLVDTYGSGFVTENGNTYVKVNFRGWDSWAAFNLGYYTAGTYYISMEAKLVEGTMNGRFGYNVGNGKITEMSPIATDGETYIFKVTLAEDVENFNVGYKSVSGANANFTVHFDNISIMPVANDNEVHKIVSENFDSLTLIEGVANDFGGVYSTDGKFTVQLVADANGGNKLQFTKTASGYGVVALSLGTLTAGNYKLTLDAEMAGGYPAIMQVAQITKSNGVAAITIKQELDNSLMDLATVEGNTYTFRFSMTGTYENVAIAIATNTSATGETITLDNISLTEDNVLQTIDFENGVVRWADANLGLMTVKGKATSNVTNTLTSNVATDETGNQYFTVNYKGWGSWSAFNFGYLKAGTYTITMDVKVVSGTMNGNFIKYVGGKRVAITEGVDYTVDGTRYTFTITLDSDCANFGIGYASVAGANANFVLGYDNIFVTVGGKVDGGAGDNYDWINGFISKKNN